MVDSYMFLASPGSTYHATYHTLSDTCGEQYHFVVADENLPCHLRGNVYTSVEGAVPERWAGLVASRVRP
jgi:hypothetical protein